MLPKISPPNALAIISTAPDIKKELVSFSVTFRTPTIRPIKTKTHTKSVPTPNIPKITANKTPAKNAQPPN